MDSAYISAFKPPSQDVKAAVSGTFLTAPFTRGCCEELSCSESAVLPRLAFQAGRACSQSYPNHAACQNYTGNLMGTSPLLSQLVLPAPEARSCWMLSILCSIFKLMRLEQCAVQDFREKTGPQCFWHFGCTSQLERRE